MLPTTLTSFPRPAVLGERRCFGMSSAVPGSPSPPVSGSVVTSPTTFRVGSPGGAGSTLSTSPVGGGAVFGATGFGNGVCSSTIIVPDLHAQKAVLEQLLDRALSEGDFWYVVVAEWLEHLKRYLGITSTRKYYQKRVTALPGPIVTRRDFAHTVDVVHEDAWRMLVQWYGLSEGHKPMKLVVYRYARGPEIEHNVNTFKLMMTTSPPEDFHNVRFSKMERVGHVEWRMRQLYAVPIHQQSRLWARTDLDSDWRVILTRDSCIGRALDMDSDFTRPVLALEILQDNNAWIHPPEGSADCLMDLTAIGDVQTTVMAQEYPTGNLFEHSIFDDITTSWEMDIHDQIDHMGKTFLERLHGNFTVFVQRARDYVSEREAQLRERERHISSREAVTERLASRLEDKERQLLTEMANCEEKMKDYDRRRLELEREMAQQQEAADRELQEQRQELKNELKQLESDKDRFSEEMKVIFFTSFSKEF